MPDADPHVSWMQRAIELAARGEGHVEPNPMVGCVLVQADRVVGEGWHQKFGDHHAEVHAILAAGESARGATAYVTLEPCSHTGKTPPCCDALIDAGVTEVHVACSDPNPAVSGEGIRRLSKAGIQVHQGLLESAARQVLAPYLKRTTTGRPWVIAKWAMTMDGRIATATGDSKWISSPASRQIVHQIRGRVDAIVVGAQTAMADDPMLTARPAGPRVATRVVVDSTGRMAVDCQLAQTANEIPVVVWGGPDFDDRRRTELESAGVEVNVDLTSDRNDRLMNLLNELGRRGMTNVLVEGGGQLLGAFHDLKEIDELHLFMAAKLIGGADSRPPVVGQGIASIADATRLKIQSVNQVDQDVYVVARSAGN